MVYVGLTGTAAAAAAAVSLCVVAGRPSSRGHLTMHVPQEMPVVYVGAPPAAHVLPCMGGSCVSSSIAVWLFVGHTAVMPQQPPV